MRSYTLNQCNIQTEDGTGIRAILGFKRKLPSWGKGGITFSEKKKFKYSLRLKSHQFVREKKLRKKCSPHFARLDQPNHTTDATTGNATRTL